MRHLDKCCVISKIVFKMIDRWKLEKKYFAVFTVPADGLAPLGARPSAGTVQTKFRSCVKVQDQYSKCWILLHFSLVKHAMDWLVSNINLFPLKFKHFIILNSSTLVSSAVQ